MPHGTRCPLFFGPRPRIRKLKTNELAVLGILRRSGCVVSARVWLADSATTTMALGMMGSPVPELQCGLCDRALDPLKPFFRANGSFLAPSDPLIRYANTPLHWPCYAAWPERSRFARAYVCAWVRANHNNPFWWTVLSDERVFISVNPERTVEEALVRLCDVGSDIRVPLANWSRWLATPLAVTPRLQELEQQCLERVQPILRDLFPDDHALVDAIDSNEKRRKRC
jgi:hypothetical protein